MYRVYYDDDVCVCVACNHQNPTFFHNSKLIIGVAERPKNK